METLQHGSWASLGVSCPQSASISMELPGTGPVVAQTAGAWPLSVQVEPLLCLMSPHHRVLMQCGLCSRGGCPCPSVLLGPFEPWPLIQVLSSF